MKTRKTKRTRAPAFLTAEGGEWFDIVPHDQLLSCCDCGLAHSIDLRIKDGQWQMRAFRLNRVTRVLRRRQQAAQKQVGTK